MGFMCGSRAEMGSVASVGFKGELGIGEEGQFVPCN